MSQSENESSLGLAYIILYIGPMTFPLKYKHLQKIKSQIKSNLGHYPPKNVKIKIILPFFHIN